MEGNNRRLVLVLGGALGFSLLVIAFLLGRVTAERSEPARVADGAPVAAAAQAAPAPPVRAGSAAPANPLPVPAGVPPAFGEDDAVLPLNAGWVPPVAIPAPTLPEPGGPGPSVSRTAEQRDIEAYFTQVDMVNDVGAGDPQAFATSLLQSVSSGDFSGFDDLLTTAREQQQRLRGIAPPPACLDHHRLAVALSADSVAMLERLKAALMKGDSTALLTIATEGGALEKQANQLKSMGESIKRTAGL